VHAPCLRFKGARFGCERYNPLVAACGAFARGEALVSHMELHRWRSVTKTVQAARGGRSGVGV
jgi:hypothetical protein